MTVHPTDEEDVHIADYSNFFVGASHTEIDGRSLSQGGMYVEKFVPLQQSQSFPVVMLHGAGQTGTNFTGTPDGRRGWLHDFLRAGYTVYIVDQAERGRSGHTNESVQGDHLVVDDARKVEDYFTCNKKNQLWPQARHHSQWPGSGEVGDPAFDQFHASQVDGLRDRAQTERLNQQAGIKLLDRIGPAILLTHSQAGPIGWLIADACPEKVKVILSLEPNGPPFYDVLYTGEKQWYQYNLQKVERPYGITRIPMTYDPPLGKDEHLAFEKQLHEADEALVTGYLQPHSPRRLLPHLQGIPIMIMIAQASYHSPYDHLTSIFLKQAGVENDLIYLEQLGFTGNGHMVMLEKNNHQVADFMINWLDQHSIDQG